MLVQFPCCPAVHSETQSALPPAVDELLLQPPNPTTATPRHTPHTQFGLMTASLGGFGARTQFPDFAFPALAREPQLRAHVVERPCPEPGPVGAEQRLRALPQRPPARH